MDDMNLPLSRSVTSNKKQVCRRVLPSATFDGTVFNMLTL